MHYLPNPRMVQFEISNVCNALCSSCQRNTIDFKTLKQMHQDEIKVDITNLPMMNRPGLGKPQYLPLEVFENVMTNCKSLQEIYFTGTIDDPLAHKDLVGVTKLCLDLRPDIFLGVHTNGSMRTPKYLKEWGEVLASQKDKNHQIWFSIDGLEDTNHYYRKNCRWDKIMANAEALISTGAKVGWQFLVFPWNEHQVDEAREMAKKIGFKKFRTRINKSPLLNDLDKTLLKSRKEMKKIRRYGFELDAVKVPDDPIVCEWQGSLSQYHVSWDGRLWPCCYFNSFKVFRNDELKERIDGIWGEDWNNLAKRSWQDIMNHEFYQEDLVSSWSAGEHGTTKGSRIRICSQTCSKKVAYPGSNFVQVDDLKTGKQVVQEAGLAIAKNRQEQFAKQKKIKKNV